MAKFDFKKLVSDSADKLKSGAQKAQESVKSLDLQSMANDVASKGKEAAQLLRQKADETVQTVSEAVKRKEEIHGFITSDGAVKLMCMVIAIDGNIAEEELAKISEIGGELDPGFAEHQAETVAECTALVKKLEPSDYQEELYDTARDIVEGALNIAGANVPVKLLLWNLLVVAQCDSSYQEEEAKLIRYIAKHLGVDKSIIPEMENSIRAVLAVDNEISWLKTTERPFGIVEPVLNELANRKAAIMQGVHMLIND